MAGAGAITTLLTTPTSRSASLFIGGRDFSSSLFLESLKVRDVVGNTRATLETTLRGAVVDLPELYDQARVRFVDHTAGDEPFTGFLRSKHPITGIDPKIEVLAEERAALLDDIWIDVELRPPESMQARIGYFWGMYAGSQFSGDLSFVANIGGTLPLQRYDTVTLRQVIEMIVVQASSTAQFHVDNMGRPHVFTSETNDAPYDVVHATPAGGEVAPTDLDINFDGGAYFNRVLVKGASPEATVFVQDDAAIASAAGLVRTGMLQATEVTTEAMAIAVGQQYLASQKAAVARGTFSVESTYDGWRSGQNLTVNDPDIFSSPQPFQIRSVERRVSGRGSNQLHSQYTIEFGGRAIGLEGEGQAPLIAGRSGSIYMLDQLGNAIISNAAAASLGGIGPAVRRYITSGVYNGDFYAPPPGPDAPIDNATNPLPYWTVSIGTGNADNIIDVVDANTGSHRRVRTSIQSGTGIALKLLFQQVPINASDSQAFFHNAKAYVVNTGGTNPATLQARLSATYNRFPNAGESGYPQTGTLGDVTVSLATLGVGGATTLSAIPNGGRVPADAYFLSVQLQLQRDAGATETGAVEWSELWLETGQGIAPQGALARRTTTQSITTSTWSPVSFNASEDYDPFAFHDTGVNPSRFTVPTGWGGTYLLVGRAGFAASTATREIIGWGLNGAAPADSSMENTYLPNASFAINMEAVTVMELSAGGYVELMVWHNQGGNINTGADSYATITYIGEQV